MSNLLKKLNIMANKLDQLQKPYQPKHKIMNGFTGLVWVDSELEKGHPISFAQWLEFKKTLLWVHQDSKIAESVNVTFDECKQLLEKRQQELMSKKLFIF